MPLNVEATYENGIFKLSQPLPLKEHDKVRGTVHTGPTCAERSAGMMGWTGSTEEADYFAMSPDLDVPTPEEEPQPSPPWPRERRYSWMPPSLFSMG